MNTIIGRDWETGDLVEIELNPNEPTHKICNGIAYKLTPEQVAETKARWAADDKRRAARAAAAEKERAETDGVLAKMDKGEASQQEIAKLLRRVLPQ